MGIITLWVLNLWVLVVTQPAFICSKLTMEVLEQCVILCKVNDKDTRTTSKIVNFEQIFILCLGVSIGDFEQVNAYWEFLFLSESMPSQIQHPEQHLSSGVITELEQVFGKWFCEFR